MKKKAFALLLLGVSTVGIYADPIDLNKAKEVASVYMVGQQEPTAVNTTTAKRITNDGQQPLYIFNRGEGQGFVIISGDDCLPMVLGYTEQGDYDPQNLPPALLDWISGYSNLISEAQAQGAKTRIVKRATTTKRNVNPLVTAHWNQGAPYNNLCPFRKDGGGRALTGCVATAAAQVAYYWRKEATNRSQYDTPTYGYGDAPVTESIPKGTPLQWELMRDSYGSDSPEDMQTAVATLMSVIGTSTWLTYGSSTSGQIRDLVNTFNGQLHLNSKCTYKNHSQSAWEDLVYSDLEKGWPIVYSGVSPTQGGHAVVLDGYRASDNLFHFNFGWGGGGDGWFTIDDQTGMNGFNGQQGMTHTIHPRQNKFLTGDIEVGDIYARMKNTIRVKITNEGTTDYSGTYLAIERKEQEPASINDASLKDLTTVIPSGETGIVEFSYRATTANTVYLYLMDNTGRILAKTTTEAYAQKPLVTLDNLELDAASETGETQINLEGENESIIYNKVYSDAVKVTATLSNEQEATNCSPTFECTLYQYDNTSSGFKQETTLTAKSDAFVNGTTQPFTFEFENVDKEGLYAVQLHRTYSAGNVDFQLNTAGQDTIVYFRLEGCDLTMTSLENGCATFKGHWNKNQFNTLVAGQNIVCFDMQNVTGMDETPETENPNALFYVNEDSRMKGQNIIRNGVCEDLQLTAGYDFQPLKDFTAQKAVFNPMTSDSKWKYIAVPFDCNVPDGSRARRFIKLTNLLISTSDEVNTTLKRGIPYMYKTAIPGEDRIEAENAFISTAVPAEASDTLCMTFVNMTGAENHRMLNTSETPSFVSANEKNIPAFSGYLNYDKDISTSIYSYQSKDNASDELVIAINEALSYAENTQEQLTEKDYETLLAQINSATSCYTRHADIQEIENMTASLTEAIKECRMNQTITDEPLDITESYLTNASFERGRTTGWSVKRVSGQNSKCVDVTALEEYMVDSDGTYVYYSYSTSGAGSATISQKAEALRNGYYRVSAYLATDNGQTVTLYANEKTADMTDDGFGKRYLRKTVIDSVLVENGTLEIGVKGNDGWYRADNFRIFYLGDQTTTGITSVSPAEESVQAWGGQGCIYLQTTDEVAVNIYTLDGRTIRKTTVSGTQQINGLPKGLYFVNRTKVIVK